VKTTDIKPNKLMKQIHATWQADKEVASLLSPNLTGSFNRVVSV
jgi:hypothetical protein